ncbi:hypothetical protein V8C37DRAFT_373908 [Trichoderma ceciliae]
MAALQNQAVSSPTRKPQPPDASRPKPVSASALASIEKQRRDLVRSLGPCRSGCEDLDKYVLLGGLERGSVVGISAEEEDEVGLTLSLQVLVSSLLDGAAQKVQVVTPKPPSAIVVLLKNGITAELKARGATAPDEIATQRRDCLDRIMLSRVFDMDGLREVLADLDGVEDAWTSSVTVDARPVERTTTQMMTQMVMQMAPAPSVVAEIQDSQGEDEALSPSQPLTATPQLDAQGGRESDGPRIVGREAKGAASGARTSPSNSNMSVSSPDILLVTHFSSLLTSFFTQRDKSAAHAALRLLASRLRRLSRTLPSNPLIILVNSTDSGAASATAHSPDSNRIEIPPPEQSATPTAYGSHNKSSVDPTLRSIFNSAPLSSHAGASPYTHSYRANKTNKPTFGLVFTQLLDLHLLCTRAPRPSKATSPRAMTVVEVLLDDIGVWEGERGRRGRREQRWTMVASRNGRIVRVPES